MRLNNTAGENSRTRKLSAKDVCEIRKQKGKKTVDQLGQRYGIHPYTIYKIWNGRLWKSV
jgi:hypothetical protein